MQSHELFGQVTDHIVGDVWQVEHFAKSDIFCKTNDARQPSWDVNTELSNQATQAVLSTASFDGPKDRAPDAATEETVVRRS